jgi:hypothetical protein
MSSIYSDLHNKMQRNMTVSALLRLMSHVHSSCQSQPLSATPRNNTDLSSFHMCSFLSVSENLCLSSYRILEMHDSNLGRQPITVVSQLKL